MSTTPDITVVGRDLSPFVRRVRVSLLLLGIAHEQNGLATTTDLERIRAINPLARVPALLLEGDEPPLVDSWAILDHIDAVAGPARALVPPAGAARRAVLRLVALGTGVMEKGVQSFYERTRRPEEKQHAPWRDHCDAQVAGGLAALDAAALTAESLGQPHLTGERLTQADVTAAVALDFIRFTGGYLAPAGSYPSLEALAARLATLPAFQETSLERFR